MLAEKGSFSMKIKRNRIRSSGIQEQSVYVCKHTTSYITAGPLTLTSPHWEVLRHTGVYECLQHYIRLYMVTVVLKDVQ